MTRHGTGLAGFFIGELSDVTTSLTRVKGLNGEIIFSTDALMF